MKSMAIYPSLMSASSLYLAREIKKLEPYCDGFHIDVMDYHFVPNLTFGIGTINDIVCFTQKSLWFHLMMEKSSDFIKTITVRENDIVSFHIEEKSDHKKLIKYIQEKKARASVAIRPKTTLSSIFELMHSVDQVLVMSVEPGFSGQCFFPETFEKIKNLGVYKKNNKLACQIGCDGGISEENIGLLASLGVDCVAISHAIFGQKNPVEALKKLHTFV